MEPDKPLILTRFPNGGWTVTQGRGGGWEVKLLGAYSSAEELLRGLRDILMENPQP